MTIDEDVWADTLSNVFDESGTEGDGSVDNPVAVHDVKMNPFDTRRNRIIHRLSKFAEIRGQNAWSDNQGSCP